MTIENLRKHLGVLGNTGVRVAVVFRKLPNDNTHCLIVETERLPDSYHDYIQQLLSSRDAKETNDFYELLNRRSFPDGTNCLTSLHQRGYLRKEPVTNINMIPLPGQSVPLGLINATIDKKLEEYTADQASGQSAIDSLLPADNAAIARGLLAKVDRLEREAADTREEAYTIDPTCRPRAGRPVHDDLARLQAIEDRKVKRLARDRDKAAKDKVKAELNKEVKKVTDVDSKMADKIMRDAARLTPT